MLCIHENRLRWQGRVPTLVTTASKRGLVVRMTTPKCRRRLAAPNGSPPTGPQVGVSLRARSVDKE
jgi:hypothetical protein